MNRSVHPPQPGDTRLRNDGTMQRYVDAVTGWVKSHNPGAEDFARLGERDRAHLRSTGRPNGHVKPELTGRAADLALALRPLHKVAPVLRGNYLVKGWIDRGAASVVYGESNVGKHGTRRCCVEGRSGFDLKILDQKPSTRACAQSCTAPTRWNASTRRSSGAPMSWGSSQIVRPSFASSAR